jgi:hypothetical protein
MRPSPLDLDQHRWILPLTNVHYTAHVCDFCVVASTSNHCGIFLSTHACVKANQPAGQHLEEHHPVAVHVRLGRQLPHRRILAGKPVVPRTRVCWPCWSRPWWWRSRRPERGSCGSPPPLERGFVQDLMTPRLYLSPSIASRLVIRFCKKILGFARFISGSPCCLKISSQISYVDPLLSSEDLPNLDSERGSSQNACVSIYPCISNFFPQQKIHEKS